MKYLLPLAGLLALSGCFQNQKARAERKNLDATQSYVEAALAYQEGDRERALASLQSALAQNPDLIMGRLLLGTIYRDKNEYSFAAEQYQKVVQLDPYTGSNHYNLGLMYHLLNRLADASVSYIEAIRLNPADGKSNMNMGLVHTALGKPELGLSYAQKAVELNEKSAEAHANLAVVLDSMGRHAEAEKHYRRAIELDTRPETIANLAGNLVSQRKFTDAIASYEEALRLKDAWLLRQRYGHALLLAGRTDDAIREFQHALRQNERSFQALNGLGDAMLIKYRESANLDEGKRVTAVDYWRKSLSIHPNQPKVSELVKEYGQMKAFP